MTAVICIVIIMCVVGGSGPRGGGYTPRPPNRPPLPPRK